MNLPDGGTVSSQSGSEGWEAIDSDGLGFSQQFQTEGWEAPILVLSKLGLSAGATEISVGGSVVLTVESRDDDGSLVGGVPFDLRLTDPDRATSIVESGQTEADGTLETTVELAEKGKYEVQAVNTEIASQFAARFESIGVSFDDQFGPEGWES